MSFDLSFYSGKTVLVTGHTGFKGSWLCRILVNAGAKVIGYSLEAPTNPNLFGMAFEPGEMVSVIGDVRDYEHLYSTFEQYRPEIVFHLAAQPIVLTSYQEPRYTYETNVMGTVNVLECIRLLGCVRSFVNVTTDKVYANDDAPDHLFQEDEPLDGYDPYSNSKSCSELVTHSYVKSFFKDPSTCAISTCRAGNVIGGGDFSPNRILPDCVRALMNKTEIIVRNPDSIRPYQHVLEALYIYLLIAKAQWEDRSYCGYYNVGPDRCDCSTTGELVKRFCSPWGERLKWEIRPTNGPHEAAFLQLDNAKIKRVFGWKPRWHIDEAVGQTVEWVKVYLDQDAEAVRKEMAREIDLFFGGVNA